MTDDDLVRELATCDVHAIPKFSFAGLSFYTRIIDCHDGDSYRIVVDVNGTLSYVMTRLVGIDTADIASKNAVEKSRAVAARDYALSWALQTPVSTFGSKKEIKAALEATPAIVFVECQEFDKYGRVLVHVYRTRDAGPSLNEQLITAGHAIAYAGGAKVHDWTAL
jgi:endonuclease YncB( thermonuclease family)